MQTTIAWLLTKAEERVARHTACVHRPCCLLCGGEARVVERRDATQRFCDVQQCQRGYRALDQFLALGMPGGLKRLRDYGKRPDVYMPDEILAELTLLAYGARLESRKEYEELTGLRLASHQFRRVIDLLVLPRIQALGDDLLYELPLSELERFTGLRQLAIAEGALDGPERVTAVLENLSVDTLFDLGVYESLDPYALYPITGEQLARLTALRSLVLVRANQIDDAAIRTLRSLTRLEIKTSVTLTGDAFSALGALQTLLLDDAREIRDLSALSSLRRLVVRERGALELASLANLTALENLSLHELPGDYTHARLAALTHLRHLALADATLVGDEALVPLTGLESLILGTSWHGQSRVTAASVSRLGALRLLDLGRSSVVFHRGELQALSRSLQWLKVGRSSFYESQLQRELSSLSQLTYLDLHESYFYWPIDEYLSGLVHLHTLIMRGSLSPERPSANDRFTGVVFRQLPALTYLNLDTCTDVSDEALLLLSCQLRKLSLIQNYRITDASISRMTALEELYLTHRRRNTQLATLEALPRLRFVAAYGTLIEGSGEKERWQKLTERVDIHFGRDFDQHADTVLPASAWVETWQDLVL